MCYNYNERRESVETFNSTKNEDRRKSTKALINKYEGRSLPRRFSFFRMVSPDIQAKTSRLRSFFYFMCILIVFSLIFSFFFIIIERKIIYQDVITIILS